MTTAPVADFRFEVLPNPRGGAILLAEAALAEAAVAPGESACRTAAAALHDAGWFAAQSLALALADAARAEAVAGSAGATGAMGATDAFRAALHDIRAAVARRNLRELACSPALLAHYRGLMRVAQPGSRAGWPAGVQADSQVGLPARLLAQRPQADARAQVPADTLALAGRPVPPASFAAVPAGRLARVRAGYEAALLAVLREPQAPPAEALDALDACFAALAGPDPYDYWRLARACLGALRRTPGADLKRWLARGNLLLRAHEQGATVAEAAVVRETLALVWRDFALYGAQSGDTATVELLNDYGLTVGWHPGTSCATQMQEGVSAQLAAERLREQAAVRQLGVVTVNARAHDDFLMTADAAAAALGLGQTALAADALALGWRRVMHGQWPSDGGAALAAGAVALHKIAAGVVPPDLGEAREALGAVLAVPWGRRP